MSGTPYAGLGTHGNIASVASSPTDFSIISCVRTMSADGRSILLMTGNDLESVRDREVGIRKRLRLDTLRGIDDKQRSFARSERT